MDILFSGRAAPGQNVRIPRARAAVSVGTVATRWRGFTHTPAVLHAAAERALAWQATVENIGQTVLVDNFGMRQ